MIKNGIHGTAHPPFTSYAIALQYLTGMYLELPYRIPCNLQSRKWALNDIAFKSRNKKDASVTVVFHVLLSSHVETWDDSGRQLCAQLLNEPRVCMLQDNSIACG